MRFDGETEDLEAAAQIGKKWGYGNVIHWLKDAWSQELQTDPRWKFDKATADMAAHHVCAWCKVDGRTGKKVKSRGPRS